MLSLQQLYSTDIDTLLLIIEKQQEADTIIANYILLLRRAYILNCITEPALEIIWNRLVKTQKFKMILQVGNQVQSKQNDQSQHSDKDHQKELYQNLEGIEHLDEQLLQPMFYRLITLRRLHRHDEGDELLTLFNSLRELITSLQLNISTETILVLRLQKEIELRMTSKREVGNVKQKSSELLKEGLRLSKKHGMVDFIIHFREKQIIAKLDTEEVTAQSVNFIDMLQDNIQMSTAANYTYLSIYSQLELWYEHIRTDQKINSEVYDRLHTSIEKLEDTTIHLEFMLKLAQYYKYMGNVESSYTVYQSMIAKQDIDRPLINTLNRGYLALSQHHVIRGQLQQARKFLNEGLKRLQQVTDTNNSPLITRNLHIMRLRKASVLVMENRIEEAVQLYNSYLEELAKEDDDVVRNLSGWVWTLLELQIIYHENQDYTKVKHYANQIEQIIKATSTVHQNRFAYYLQFSKAMKLSMGDRIENRVEAMNILRELDSTENWNTRSNTSLINRSRLLKLLCSLLLDETSYINSEAAFAEARSKVELLEEIATEANAFMVMIDTQILRSRFAIIEAKYDQAREILLQAIDTAKQQQMARYVQLLNDEVEQLTQNFKQYQEVLDQNVSLKDKLEKARIQDYIKNAKSLISE